jgi:mRNA interferase HigB
MWIVSLQRLREFWNTHADAERPLRAWYTVTTAAQWRNFGDLRANFPIADLVGNCTVFNIGGNKFRLVTRILFVSHKVFVLRVMTHRVYDQTNWAEDCGCYRPPPKRRTRTARPQPPRRTSP